MKIASTTITGNREQEIKDALLSVVDVVDIVVVIDTGITDHTLDVARAVARDKLFLAALPWADDFGAARNHALGVAALAGADWALTLDTDERMQWRGLDLRVYLAGLPEDVEVVDVREARGHYPKERLFRLPRKGGWGERVHEAFVMGAGNRRVEAPTARFSELPKTAEAQAAKVARDVRILRGVVKKEPGNSRAWYYLGQSLEGSEPAAAAKAFAKAFATTGWDEEAGWSAYRASVVLVGLGNHHEALAWCARGMTKHAAMAELPWHAAWICNEKLGDPRQALRWARIAIAMNERASGFRLRASPDRASGAEKARIGFSYPLALFDGPCDIARRACIGLGDVVGAQTYEALRQREQGHRAIYEGALGASEPGAETPAEAAPSRGEAASGSGEARSLKPEASPQVAKAFADSSRRGGVPRYDVIFVDGVGDSYDWQTHERYALGGSELALVVLAEELGRAGYQVCVVNRRGLGGEAHTNRGTSPTGVRYATPEDLSPGTLCCETLVVSRYTPRHMVEGHFSARRVVRWVEDIPTRQDGPGRARAPSIARGEHACLLEERREMLSVHVPWSLVAASPWQASLFEDDIPAGNLTVIPNMLPREVFAVKEPEEPHPRSFVYASGVVKGLEPTLAAWRRLRYKQRGEAKLHVYTPAWSAASPKTEADGDVVVHGPVPLAELLEAIVHSRGLFYVNAFPETFCNVVAMCEALGRRVHVRCLNDLGAIPTTLKASQMDDDEQSLLRRARRTLSAKEPLLDRTVRTYHPAKLLPRWLEVLGLPAPKARPDPSRGEAASGEARSPKPEASSDASSPGTKTPAILTGA